MILRLKAKGTTSETKKKMQNKIIKKKFFEQNYIKWTVIHIKI